MELAGDFEEVEKQELELGARKINVASSPRSDSSSCQKDQDPVTVNGIHLSLFCFPCCRIFA